MKKKMTKEEVLTEIYENRNHSWFSEIKNRSQGHLKKVALKYRGLDITFEEYINKCEKEWAPALKAAGISKGTEIVACISSTPEFCYLFGAASIVGAKINFVSDEFDSDYLYEICSKASSKYIFVGEDKINGMSDTLKKIEKNTDKIIVPVGLNYSLPNGNPFKEVTDNFINYNFNDVIMNLFNLKNVESLDKFIKRGEEYTGNVYENVGLDDEFTISYSSGTTDGNRPKGIVHRNRHYIVMGRYHDSEISGLPNFKDSVTLSTIPTQSNSYIASILSDTLMEGACIALDPIISKEYFLYSMKINNPYMSIATTSSWLYAAKYYYSLSKEQQKAFKYPNLFLPVCVGEPMSPGEEKLLNKFVFDTGCGTNITKLPFSITKMSICGGDCEHGSLFTRVLREYANLKKDRNIKEPIGLSTYDFVEVKALRKDGTYCDTNEYGRLVANSACTMVGYKDDPERTEKFFITDAYGKKWADLGCHGYLDKDNNIYMKGRISEDKSDIPEFLINDEIQKDYKNILSSSVVKSDDNYIAYIEPQLFTNASSFTIFKNVVARLNDKFGEDFVNKLYINLVDHKESFPLTACLKRDNNLLRQTGLTDDCFKASSFVITDKNKQLIK